MKRIENITIIGYGNQAKAWALNLRDSGLKVHIGLRSNSSSFSIAESAGFATFNFETTPLPTKDFVLLIPDDQHSKALTNISKLNSNGHCLYAHGYSLTSENLNSEFPMFEHSLLAPKSIASELRFLYETKGDLGGIYSNEFSNISADSLKALATDLGLKKIYPASFKEETEADLFSEQSILCALLPYGAMTTFNTLIKNGYPKELAYFECFHEIKLIADTLLKVGPQDFFNMISPNALLGAEVGKEKLLDSEFQNGLNSLLEDIKKGHFNNKVNETDFAALRKNVSNFWKEQELTKVYQSIKEDL